MEKKESNEGASQGDGGYQVFLSANLQQINTFQAKNRKRKEIETLEW